MGPFLEPKSLQNRFRSGFGRALDEDSISKLKKGRAASSASPQTGGFLSLCGEGNREGTVSFTRLTTCPRTGVGGSFLITEIDLDKKDKKSVRRIAIPQFDSFQIRWVLVLKKLKKKIKIK